MLLKDAQILVVEDSSDLIMLWKAQFAKHGIKAQFAKSGQEALIKISEGFLPDILMTDFSLPDMTGSELINHIRVKLKNLKCIVASGHSESDIRDILPPDTHFVLKPVQIDKLKELFEHLTRISFK